MAFPEAVRDLEHIGIAPQVAAESGTPVYAHGLDGPYTQVEKPLLKLAPDWLAAFPAAQIA